MDPIDLVDVYNGVEQIKAGLLFLIVVVIGFGLIGLVYLSRMARRVDAIFNMTVAKANAEMARIKSELQTTRESLRRRVGSGRPDSAAGQSAPAVPLVSQTARRS